VKAGDPYWYLKYTDVGGTGSQSCTGTGWKPQRVRVAIETYSGFGIWKIEIRDGDAFTDNNPISYPLTWDCRGSGTQTYRTVVDGYAAGGGSSASVQSGSQPRFTCSP
jgi:hypothetical protein